MSVGSSSYRIPGLLLALVGAVTAAVVSLVGIRSAKAQSTEELFNYPQTFLNGEVSAKVGIPMESCRKLCSTRSGCAGFDYSFADGLCRLFKNVAGASESQPHIAGTRSLVMGYHPPSNPPVAAQPPEPPIEEATASPPPASFTRFRNRDLTGEATETIGALDADQCEGMCRSADAWCRAYTFDAWNRKCFLKEGTGQLLVNARATSGVLSSLATPTSSQADMYFEYFNNKAFPGDGFHVLSARSRDKCGSECWALNQCVAFSFTASQRRCILFDQPGEYSSSQGTSSGAKRQD
ncbi:PAN domain-containing protein [Mesorhizobium sp. M0142]|uniref:PAN domain-containing protein n=1 Tax=unclassified Mesorhizobium TaxID=325217 RepID=UPI0033355622